MLICWPKLPQEYFWGKDVIYLGDRQEEDAYKKSSTNCKWKQSCFCGKHNREKGGKWFAYDMRASIHHFFDEHKYGVWCSRKSEIDYETALIRNNNNKY